MHRGRVVSATTTRPCVVWHARRTTHGVRRWPVNVCRQTPVRQQHNLTVWSPLRHTTGRTAQCRRQARTALLGHAHVVTAQPQAGRRAAFAHAGHALRGRHHQAVGAERGGDGAARRCAKRAVAGGPVPEAVRLCPRRQAAFHLNGAAARLRVGADATCRTAALAQQQRSQQTRRGRHGKCTRVGSSLQPRARPQHNRNTGAAAARSKPIQRQL